MAKSIEKHHIITPGTYSGVWTAYNVNIIFNNGNKSGDIKLDEGIRGINFTCVVIVDNDGWVYVH